MPTIKELQGWPPRLKRSQQLDGVSPEAWDEIVIEAVEGVYGRSIAFSCQFQGESLTYKFHAADEKTADEVASVLRDHVGEALASIMEVEISPDEIWTR